MKKVIFAALVGFFALSASAQFRPSFIIQGGYQGSNFSGKGAEGAKMLSGFRVGVAADFQVYEDMMVALSIQPGINFATKGAKGEESAFGVKGSMTQALHYLEVPVLLNGRFGMGSDMSVFVNAGPYFAYGIGGKTTYSLGENKRSDSSNPFKDTEVAGVKFKGFKPFDIGIQVGAGVEYRRILVGLGGQFGLNPLVPDADKKDNVTNTGFFATVGYRF